MEERIKKKRLKNFITVARVFKKSLVEKKWIFLHNLADEQSSFVELRHNRWVGVPQKKWLLLGNDKTFLRMGKIPFFLEIFFFARGVIMANPSNFFSQ
jgi:hypothetical protein